MRSQLHLFKKVIFRIWTDGLESKFSGENSFFLSTPRLSASSDFFEKAKLFILSVFLLSMMLFGVGEVRGQCSNTITFNSAGNDTWTAPAGVTSITVEMWGAGGAGGGSRTNNRQGGGGGGGAFRRAVNVTVVPGTTYTITVGAGGGGSNGDGEDGGTSSATFGATTITANGGAGGTRANGGNGDGGAGGTGGTYNGGSGADGANSGSRGGGGSSAGTGANGTNGSNSSTAGGVAPTGGGDGGNGGTNGAGESGTAPGGGGGGGERSGGNRAGGDGARGEVRISYNIAPPNAGSISGAQSICEGGDPAVLTNTAAGTGTSYRWERAVSPFTNWIPIGGATSATYNPPAGLTVTTQYRRVSIATAGCETASTPVQITVESPPNSGSIAGTQTICSGGDPGIISNSSAGSGVSYRWESAVSPFTTWTNISGATAASYDPPAGLTSTTQFRRVSISSAGCENPTVPVQLTVDQLPTANAGPALAGICQGQTTLAIGGSVGGSVSGGIWSGGAGTWNNPTDPANATYTAGLTETGTITLTLTTVGGSCGVATDTKTLTITTSPTADAGGTLVEICDGDTSAPMGGSIGGAATSGVWTNLNGTGTWTNANNPATATYTAGPNDSALGLITLQLTASGGSCSNVVVTKTIRVNSGKTVTPVSTETVCFFTGSVNLTHATTGVTGISGDGVDGANGLPAGVSATFNSATGQISIIGNATELGTFNYSIELLGTCGVASATGTIIVEDCGCIATLDYATNPSGTWVVPNGVTEVIVEGWGGGGRGGRRTSGSWAAAGGGGGGYSRSILSVNPGDSFGYAVGAGGNDSNINGGSTTFGGGLLANGGSGVENSTNGGAGAALGTGNDDSRRGGNGGNSNNSNSGGGGSSGFANSDGNNGGVLTPGTIPAGSDGGNGGPGINTSNTIGQPGQVPGGGGGGGSPRNGTTYYTGGEGGAGRIRISYTLTAGIVNGPQSICIGGSTTFTSTMAGGVWSSADPSIATVNPSTGVITGISAGAATIRYTITGCTVATSSRTIFVNSPISPGTLSGNQDICIGGDTQLLSSTAFGTWSSANPSVATVSSTGLVTGVSVGTVDIIYRLPASGGCPAPETSISINVSSPPDAGTLSGIQEVCEGGTRTFSSTISGGTWSSGNPAVATIDPSTGIVTGISAGSAILTYTVSGSGGCPDDFETRSITVTALADAGTLSGADELCVNESSTFSSTTLGGTWSSSNPAVASINSSTGVVNALSSGTATISYTVAGSGSCTDDTATRNITINPLPSPNFTSAPTGVVCIGEEVTYSTQSGQFDYDWQISGSAGTDYTITSGGSSTNNSLTLTWLTQGTKQVFLRYSNSSGCQAASFISSPISVSPLPTPTFIVEPSGDYCLNETVTYTTQSGRANYTWNISGVQGTDYTIVAGESTTNTISIAWLTTGSKTVSVNYDNASGCSGVAPASNSIDINSLPVPTFTAAPSGPVCIGQEVTYTTQSSSDISDYDWTISGDEGVDYTITAGGNDETISIIWLTDGQKTVTVNYENSSGCEGVSPAISTINLDPLPVPTFTTEPSNPVCIGDEVTYTTESGQSNYIWTVTGVSGTDYNITAGSIGTSSNTVTIEWLTDGDKTVTVNYSNANGCTNSTPVSNTINLDPLPVPTFTSEPSDPVCIGSDVTYTTESGQSNYIWTVSGTVGNDYNITAGGIGTSSNTVTIQWLTDGTKTVTVNYTDANGCTGISPASNTINLDPLPNPSFTVEPSNPVCLNDVVTYTTEVGQFDYDWTVPGVEGTDYNITGGGIGTGSNTVTIEWLTPGAKTVTVNYTDANGCSIASPASNTIEISTPVSIDPVIDPGQLGDTECFGDGFDPITITATGSALTFQWYRKPDNSDISTNPGTAVSGATSATFTPPSSPEGISYYYVVVSGICGASEASELTGAYIVSPSGTSINLDLDPTAPDEEFCFGAGTFSQLEIAATGDGGISADYQWYQNTTPNNTGGILLTGETNSTFTPPSDASLADGLPRYYYATATSPSCGTVTSSVSGAFIVNPLTSIDSENLSSATICEGQGPFNSISASASGTGTLSYQWYSNTTGIIDTGVDTQVGTNSDTFSPPSNIADGIPRYYYVVVSSSGGCGPDQTSSISGGFVVNELPIPTLTPAPVGEVCVGTSVTYSTESGQSNYVWNVAGVAGTDYTISSGGIGATDHTVTLTWLTSGTKSVSINYNNSNNCAASTATVNSTIVNALPVPTFTTAPPAQVCVGTSVTYTTETGQSNYVWTIPGTAGTDYTITAGGISATNNSVTLTWLTDGTKNVSVNYTNANNCTAATATINSTVVNALPTPTFISPPPSEVCVGTPVTYTTQPGQSNYIWTVPGIAGTDYTITSGGIGTSSNTVTLRWLTAGTKNVTVNYRNSNNCSAPAAVVNSTIVNALPVPTFTSAPPSEVCVGESVTYTTQPGQSNYIWTLPGTAGTDYTITGGSVATTSNTVTLTWLTAGTKNVSINYTNATNCTAVAAVVNSTIVNALPTPTFTSSIPAEVCVGATVTYTTQPGQDSYIWTVPGTAGTDYTITAGGTGPFDNSATLRWLTNGTKVVSVNYSNSNNCTAVSALTNTIEVNQLPVPTFTDAPTTDICVGAPVTYTTQPGQVNYIWTVPGTSGIDYTITGGGIGSTSHTVTLTWLTSGTKNVSVNYSNAGGCTAVSAITNSTDINVTPVISNITGTIICSGATFNVSPLNVTNGSVPTGTTYTWTVSPNGNVTGESDVVTPQTSISQLLNNTSLVDQTVTYTVTPTSPEGCVGNTFQVDVLVRPMPTVNDPSDQDIGCSGQSTTAVNFTGNGVAGVVYNWTNSHPSIGLAASGTGNIPSFVTQNTSARPITATITVTPTVNGCPGPSQSFAITVDPTPIITLQTDYCAVDGAVLLVASSNVTGTTWEWSTGETTPSITVNIAGSYSVTATSPDGCTSTASISIAEELVVDGSFTNFDPVNPGASFFTEYRPKTGEFFIPPANGTNVTGLYDQSVYAVDQSAWYNPTTQTGYHPSFHGRDHTNNATGPRNFLMVNGGGLIGNPQRQPVVWRQEVTVEQFTEYYFSAWAMNLNPGSPARLQFKINGQLVGTVLDLDTAPKPGSEAEVSLDNWREFRSNPSWSSGTATTAIIEIVNLNTAPGGNDFALDDISFGTLSPFIRLTSDPGTDDSQVVCEDSPIVDIEYAVGGGLDGPIVTGLPVGLTATWNGVNLRISGSPTTPGEYTYEAFTTGSCQQVRVEGLIIVRDVPDVSTIASDQTVCYGDTPSSIIGNVYAPQDPGAVITYRWEMNTNISSPNWVDVPGNPSGADFAPPVLTETTQYRRYAISTVGANFCEGPPSDPVTITLQSEPVAGTIADDQTICEGEDPEAFTSTSAGSGDGTISYIWQFRNSSNPTWTPITGATGATYDSPALTETTEFQRITVSTLNGVACISNPTSTVVVTVIPENTVNPVNPDPPLCLDVPQPVTIIHTSTGATGIANGGVAGANGLPLGVSAAFNSATGDITISGTPTEVGTFNYSIPLTGGCGSVYATGTITVANPTYPITSIDVDNPAVGSSPPYVSTFTVYSPELTPGDYEIIYSTSGTNAVTDQTITVTVTTAGQFTFQSLPYSNEGTTILTLNSIQGVTDQCPFSVPTNNTVPFGINCSTEFLEADGDATFTVPTDVFQVTIDLFGDGLGGTTASQTMAVQPGGQIYLVFDGTDIFATEIPDTEPVGDRLAQAIVSTTGPNGRIVITYDCTPPPPCSSSGDVYQYTDSEGYTIIRFTGNCNWTAPDGLDEFEILVVGGGGGGGFGDAAGGGGGGAVVYQQYTGISMNGSPGLQGAVFNVSPGGQGLGATNGNEQGQNGGGSAFSGPAFDFAGSNTFTDLSAAGGGGGGTSSSNQSIRSGSDGGSGGGGAAFGTDTSGGGIADAYDDGEGNNGGTAFGQSFGGSGAGGGGAIANGVDGSGDANLMIAGTGGNGEMRSISGEDIYYGAGGGGTSAGATVNEPGMGGSTYTGSGGATFYAGGRGNNTGLGLPATTYGSGGGAGRTGGSNGFQGVIYIRYPNFRILPVEFGYFKALYNSPLRSGDLFWATAKEWENDRFDVERSINNVKTWEKIGEVKGAGYSDGTIEYDFRDSKLPLAGGNIFYRLKQIDFDGESTYSDTKSIKVEALPGTTSWRVFPNPTTGDPINLEMLDTGAYNDEKITVRVISSTGVFEIIEGDSTIELSIQLSGILRDKAAGVYTIEIAWGDRKEYHKVVLKR
ncbi:MAG: Ig-like domain-containing protein [Algoriphagus sp.]|uniref:glycine-rich domain-containing protein n=1 Tax=Algoriphagus sp. TaxID=1872435 RepID=UPI0026037B39|nr:PKD-like domain-containing protein [Algoriphagus sp.]MDG1278123.1 Ig-like domain-containing protein [Algoriphagus sp.]